MHYYQFNIGNYARDTTYLTLIEDIAYRRLLDKYYLNEGKLEKDVKKLARHIGMSEYLDDVQQVLDDFFIEEDEGFSNKRADKEIEFYHSKANTARSNGKKGGRPKKINPEETQPVNLANPEETGSKANKQITNNNQQITTSNKHTKGEKEKLELFDQIFDMYEEHGTKDVARKRFLKLSKATIKLIFNHVPGYVLSTTGIDHNGNDKKQFRKYFEGYISLKKWENKVYVPSKQINQHVESLSPEQRVEQAQKTRQATNGAIDGQVLAADDPPLQIPLVKS